MSFGSPEFVIVIVAIVMFTSVVKTALRAKYGITLGRRHRRGSQEELPGTDRQVELLTGENSALKGQVARLEERIAVLERIATDKSRRLADEIDALN